METPEKNTELILKLGFILDILEVGLVLFRDF